MSIAENNALYAIIGAIYGGKATVIMKVNNDEAGVFNTSRN